MKSKQRLTYYQSYQPSGVLWLGQLPDHWSVMRTKSILTRNDSGVWGEDAPLGGTIVLRSTEQTVDGRWQIVNPAQRLLNEVEYRSTRLRAGDLVITKSSGSALHLGKTALVTSEVEALDCCFSNFMQRLRVSGSHEPRYLYYILNSPIGREQLNFYGTTTTGLANLTGSIIGRVEIPVPPPPEQRAIADFLDRETARIDGLIAKKQRLIELLHEKRTALISHAVTKGLDPDVAMKESGVAWLGEVPAHWELFPLRRVVSKFVDYRGRTPEKVEEGIPLITAANIRNGHLDFSASREFIRGEDYDGWMVRGLPEVGDVLITTEAPLGATAQIESTNVALAQRIIMLKAEKSIIVNEYLKHYLSSVAGQGELWSRATGSTAIGIKAWRLREILVTTPPIAEQHPIIALVENEISRIDSISAKIGEAIVKLQEYRTALISAAVTGKIDVRGY